MVAKTFTTKSNAEYALRNLSLAKIIAISQAFELSGGLQNVSLPRNQKHFRDCFGSGLFWYNNALGSTCAVSTLKAFISFVSPLHNYTSFLKHYNV